MRPGRFYEKKQDNMQYVQCRSPREHIHQVIVSQARVDQLTGIPSMHHLGTKESKAVVKRTADLAI